MALPELVLAPADHGAWGSAAWRPLAYQNGAFWAGLLRDWEPNYALQPLAMFATYAFLHAGPGHLVGNALALLPLGGGVARWLGGGRALAVGAAAALGGALAFGLLSRDPSPMVGASGVVFGLAGALIAREGLHPGGRLRALALALGLALVNLAMWALMDRVAWETHAGGALAGGAVALLLRPRSAAGRVARREGRGRASAEGADPRPKPQD